jgi:hypothetical protein
VEKGDRGRLLTKLTTLGKLLVLSNSSLSTTTQQHK